MIDMNKKYKTRDGREVRIYATDGRGTYPAHGAIEITEGWESTSWTAGGYYVGESMSIHDYDLIEVKPRIKKTFEVRIYKGIYTEEFFLGDANLDYHEYHHTLIAKTTIEIDVEEGEGL
jgi:hypothetical protein